MVLLNIVVAILMVQLNDANEEVLLAAIASQSERLDELEGAPAPDARAPAHMYTDMRHVGLTRCIRPGDDLLEKLGLEKVTFDTEMDNEIMKEKRRLDALDNAKPKWEIDKSVKKAGMQERIKGK